MSISSLRFSGADHINQNLFKKWESMDEYIHAAGSWVADRESRGSAATEADGVKIVETVPSSG